MSCYKHLSIVEREKILELKSKEYSISEIARELGRNKSIISRELKRNSTNRKYSPSKATSRYISRREKCCRKSILSEAEIMLKIRSLILSEQWSPEEISKRMKREGSFNISYATIYRGIKSGKLNIQGERKTGGKYPIQRKLRRKGRKVSSTDNRGKIVISNPIEARPASANNRSAFGHYEADTVCGKQSGECLVTLVDRRSRFLLAGKCERKSDIYVKDCLVSLLAPFVGTSKLRSITPDRGKEFTSHAWVSEQLNDTPFYFANPHSPWERGTNENTNGLLREYLPKRTDISLFSDEDIAIIVNKLNHRPRKCLGWKTPFEVFFKVSLHLT